MLCIHKVVVLGFARRMFDNPNSLGIVRFLLFSCCLFLFDTAKMQPIPTLKIGQKFL
jgi:hypothetical protein